MEREKSLSDQLEERLIEFAANIVSLSTELAGTPTGKHIASKCCVLGRLQLPITPRRAELKVAQISFTSSELFRKN